MPKSRWSSTRAGRAVRWFARGLFAVLLAIGIGLPLIRHSGAIGLDPAPPIERAEPSVFELPVDAREITAGRGVQTKRFRIAGTQRFAEVSTGRAIHHVGADGLLRENKPDIRAVGSEAAADALPFAVRASADGVSIGNQTGEVLFSTRETPEVGDKTISAVFAGGGCAGTGSSVKRS